MEELDHGTERKRTKNTQWIRLCPQHVLSFGNELGLNEDLRLDVRLSSRSTVTNTHLHVLTDSLD